jgi:hypothetical protein
MAKKAEQTTEVAVQDEAWLAFQKEQEALTARSSRPSIDGLRLNGNTGTISRSHYDPDAKETTFADLEYKEFDAVVLSVKYLAKWKWREDAQYNIATREFSDFKTERIEMIKRETVAGAEAVSKYFDNYGAFKESVSMTDPETGEVKSPFDFWVSIYMLVDGEVLRLRFKGDSRTKWFDYAKTVRVLPTVVTKVGVSAPVEMPARKGELPKTYYHLTFTNGGAVPTEIQGNVIEHSKALKVWMDSFKTTKAVEEPVKAIDAPSDDEPVDVSSIPF